MDGGVIGFLDGNTPLLRITLSVVYSYSKKAFALREKERERENFNIYICFDYIGIIQAQANILLLLPE